MKFSSVEKGEQSADKIRLRSITKKKFNASLKADSVEFVNVSVSRSYHSFKDLIIVSLSKITSQK